MPDPIKTHTAKTIVFFFMWWLAAALPASATTSQPARITPNDFPVCDAITPNVAFWIQIFTQYGRSQGVIHDSRHLDRIYGIIALDPERTATAARKNKRAKKAAFKKFKTALLALAGGKLPASKREKHVAGLLGPDAGPADFRRAAFRLRCQTGIKEQFKAGLIRSGAVIDEFKRIFMSHGLPVDLVYLPCVESSFDFTAYSKFGAAGIWQFTRGTGKQFMEIGYVVDQRRDPYISTDAAARLLKRNHAELKDWALAITAYNHGLAGMRRAKKAMGTYEDIFLRYKSRSFRFASRNFYPEFLAARHVAKNHQQYFGKLHFAKPVKYTRFTTSGFLSAQSFTRALNLDIQEFQTMNPSLRSPVFKDRKYIPGEFEIRLPAHIPPHEARQAAMTLYQDKQKPSRFHVVAKGDTAGAIARIHNVSLNDLIRENGLNRRAVIYIGQNLRIPVKSQSSAMSGTILADRADTIKPSVADSLPTPKKTIVKKVEKPALVPSPVFQAEVAVTTPQQQNGAAQTSETPKKTSGDMAALPAPGPDRINPLFDASNLKIQKIVTNDNHARIGIIQVEAAETLGHYADWLKIPTNRIRTLNRLVFGNPIAINQTIKIPLAASDPDRFEEQRFEFHREIEEDFFAAFVVAEVDTYEIKSGDTIWSLCLGQLEIPFWLLKKYNPETDFNALHPGHTLNYPLVAARQEDLVL